MVIVGSWILLSGLVSDQEKNLLLTLCPPLLSVLFEIELGGREGGGEILANRTENVVPFFFSLSVSLLKTCGIVSALYRLYKRSFLFFQLKRFFH